MKLQTLSVVGAVLLVAGCAARHQDIKPVYTSEIAYSNSTCEQLRDALLNVNTALNNAANQQVTARSGDALGVFLVGLPIASMVGRDATAQVGILKGHAEAIERAGKIKKCGSLAPIIKWD